MASLHRILLNIIYEPQHGSLKESGVIRLTTVGILGHPKRPNTKPVGDHIEHTLNAHGIATWHREVWEPSDVRDQIATSDMVVAIGGDGAMLRAARLCGEFGVPVLGINMGRLGFLTEVADPDAWDSSLEPLIAGDFWIEQRMMLDARVERAGEVLHRGTALNDVVVSGLSSGSIVQMDLYIDAHWATTYSSDALIISTPTGSTAYALAVGGPILPPDLKNILILPAAAHLSMDRPIVLSEGSLVAVRLSEENRNDSIITIDGTRLADMVQNDILYINAADHESRFIRLRDPNYFYRSLLDRLEPRVNRSLPQEKILRSDKRKTEDDA
ncbi:MAG: NAD(+)/NADH kinase [Chloroflexota bacterium]